MLNSTKDEHLKQTAVLSLTMKFLHKCRESMSLPEGERLKYQMMPELKICYYYYDDGKIDGKIGGESCIKYHKRKTFKAYNSFQTLPDVSS